MRIIEFSRENFYSAHLSKFANWFQLFIRLVIRGDFKFYLADFVRKGGGGTPQIRNPLFAEKIYVKGGRGVHPKSVTYFVDQKQFLALFEETISGKIP